MNRKTKARAWRKQLFVRRKYNELYKKAEMITISKHLAEMTKNPQPDIENLSTKEDSILPFTEIQPSTGGFIRINATQSLIAFLTILKTFNQATKEQLIQLEKLQDERDELIKNLCKNS